MLETLSYTDKRKAKSKVRKAMKIAGVQVIDLFGQVPFHNTTIKKALSVNDSYYNKSIVNKAYELIESIKTK